MNKILITALLVGMSGTAFGALQAQQIGALSAEQIKALPAPAQETIQQLQAGNVKDAPQSPDVSDFLSLNGPKVEDLQTKLRDLLNKKGYLVGNPIAAVLQSYLDAAKSAIKQLTPVKDMPKEISNTVGAGPGLIEALDNMVVPDKFPGKCYNYGGTKMKGIIKMNNMRQPIFVYGEGDKDYYFFSTPLEDIGLIGNGKENYPKVSASQVDGVLDPTTKKIVCLGS